MKPTRRTLLLAALLLPAGAWSADAPPVNVHVEMKVPDAEKFGDPTVKLIREWYPKINAAIYDAEFPLPYPEIVIIFEPKIMLDTGKEQTEIPAYADKNTIHVNSPYVVTVAKEVPDDYNGMMVHELTHINQHYPEGTGPWWLTEGIADYVRHKYYEQNIESKLHLDAHGRLEGMEADRDRGKFAAQGYTDGYTVTGTFLYWLEVRKDKGIVPKLNRALRDGKYSDDLFMKNCGAPIDTLWKEFVAQSR